MLFVPLHAIRLPLFLSAERKNINAIILWAVAKEYRIEGILRYLHALYQFMF